MHHRLDELTVVDADGVHLFLCTKCLDDGVCKNDLLRVGLRATRAKHIDIHLPELTLTATLWTLVSHKVRDGVPARWIASFLLASGDHARDTRRHLGTNRYRSVTTIGKCIRLLVDDLLS